MDHVRTEEPGEYRTDRESTTPSADDLRGWSDAQLLSRIMALPVDWCRMALNKHGGLRGLASATDENITQLHAALEIGRRHMREELDRGEPLTSPQKTREYLRAALRDREYEVFCAMFLDTRHRVIAFDELFNGTIDAAHVHPRVVVEKAIQRRAAAVILAHNHPSGVAEPSQADLAITKRLRDALALLDIRLLDHFIVGDGEVVSMAERGLV